MDGRTDEEMDGMDLQECFSFYICKIAGIIRIYSSEFKSMLTVSLIIDYITNSGQKRLFK